MDAETHNATTLRDEVSQHRCSKWLAPRRVLSLQPCTEVAFFIQIVLLCPSHTSLRPSGCKRDVTSYGPFVSRIVTESSRRGGTTCSMIGPKAAARPGSQQAYCSVSVIERRR